MNDFSQNDSGKESDIDVIVEDDLSPGKDDDDITNMATDTAENKKQTDSRTKSSVQGEEEPGKPYLPRLKTSIIQMVLNINVELIRLCQEYQNNSLMDDPQLVMYQMRLQSNLAYLASVADHYMDPTRSSPDLGPLPKPSLPACQGTTIAARLAHAREIYSLYAKAWSDQQLELSKRANSQLREHEKAQFSNIDKDNLHERVEEILSKDRIVYDKASDEPITPESYKPFPPFRLPDNAQLPPGLQRWTFENNIATPE